MSESMLKRMARSLYQPQLRKLPEYGTLLFNHLEAEYSQLITQQLTTDEREEIERIKRHREGLAWNDIYLFEQILVRHLDLEDLRHKIKTLRARFRNVAGSKDYDVYMASKPPDLETETEALRLRRDCYFLLNEFYLRYTLLSAREHMRNNLLKIAALLAVVTIIVGALFAYANFNEKWEKALGLAPGITTLAVVMFAGIVGALISMQQRIQASPSEGDPIFQFSMLTHGRFGIFLSPISGAVFSVALYLMFAGGLVSGKIFPTIITSEIVTNENTPTETAMIPHASVLPLPSATSVPLPQNVPPLTISPTPIPSASASGASSSENRTAAKVAPASKSQTAPAKPVLLDQFLKTTGPATTVDYALLVIWAFIAGFAERFVPDALNRLIAKNNAEITK